MAKSSAEVWHSYECDTCTEGSGVVVDVRLDCEDETPVTMKCPKCDSGMRYKGAYPANEGGYFVRDGWSDERVADLFLRLMAEQVGECIKSNAGGIADRVIAEGATAATLLSRLDEERQKILSAASEGMVRRAIQRTLTQIQLPMTEEER